MKTAGQTIVLGMLILLACSGPETPGGVPVAEYYLDGVLRPADSSLTVEGRVTFRAPRDLTTAEFFLHRQLAVTELSAPGLQGYEFDTTQSGAYMPESGVLRLMFDSPVKEGSELTVEFTYEGRITRLPSYLASRIGNHWTELNLYLPWFPCNTKLTGDFLFDLDLDIGPEYELRSFGRPVHDGPRWRVDCDHPVRDIVVAAAHEFHTVTQSRMEQTVDVHYMSLADTTALEIADDVSSIVENYAEWFGGKVPPVMSIIESLREQGGGYGRRGLVVLSGLSDSAYAGNHEGYFRYFAHEAAHIWWWRAPSDAWQDWLNESLAEFSALMMVREKFGIDSYTSRLEQARQQAEGTPPIWGLDRMVRAPDSMRQAVHAALYAKGPVLLSELEQRIGPANFRLFLQQLMAQKVTKTEEFLRVLETFQGTDTAHWFEEQLKTR